MNSFETEHKPLEEMTLDELHQLKKERYNKAQDIIGRARFVAVTLGELINSTYTKHSWEADGVTVFVDSYGRYMTVEQDGKKVVSTHNDAFAIPGRWEDVVEKFYVLAKEKDEEDRKQREQEEREAFLRFLV